MKTFSGWIVLLAFLGGQLLGTLSVGYFLWVRHGNMTWLVRVATIWKRIGQRYRKLKERGSVEKINKIKFRWLGETYEIKDRGIAHTVQLIGVYTYSEVSDCLKNKKCSKGIIRGIEMYAIHNQTNRKIGLLIQEI